MLVEAVCMPRLFYISVAMEVIGTPEFSELEGCPNTKNFWQYSVCPVYVLVYVLEVHKMIVRIIIFPVGLFPIIFSLIGVKGSAG